MAEYSISDDLNKRINNIDNILITDAQSIRNIDIKNVDLKINHNFSLPIVFYKPPYTTNLRRAKITLFDNSLSCYENYKSLPLKEKINILSTLEKTCYNYCITKADKENIIAHWESELFVFLYNSICYKISVNISLDLINNKQLAEDILNDKIDIQSLPKLSSCDIDKKKYMNIIEKIEQGKSIVFTQKFSKMYRCRKCGESKCTTENKIKQSIDEGVGLLIRCVNCNHSWDG
jgi:DNA-directed RNA polymerase subunit M/transcription elongation factor TFIIS